MNYLSDCLIFLKNGKIRCKFPNFLTPRLELRPDVCLTQCNAPIQLFLVYWLLFILPNVRRSFFLTVFMTSICSEDLNWRCSVQGSTSRTNSIYISRFLILAKRWQPTFLAILFLPWVDFGPVSASSGHESGERPRRL